MIKTNKKCSDPDCIHNGIEQPISNFERYGKYYRNKCKDCRKKYYKEYHEQNSKQLNIKKKDYYKKNNKQILLKKKEYYIKNQEQLLLEKKKYRLENRKQLLDQKKEYYKKNRIQKLIKQKEYTIKLAKFESYNDKINFVEQTRCDPNDNDLIQIKCTYCNKWFNPTNDQMRSRVNGINNIRPECRFYCSDECKCECSIYGQRSYPKGHKRPSMEVNPEFRKMIFELDNFECQRCGRNKLEDNTVTLHCHHIEGKARNPMIDCDEYNGITFCKACHNWVHSFKGCRYVDLQRDPCEI